MAEFPSLPLFTDAYIADTQHLTNEEHGVYLRLLMFAWRTPGCALPNDDRRLAIMVGLTAKKWGRIKATVMQFWTLTEEGWKQDRLTFERQRVAEMIAQKSAAGKASARAKSRKTKETDSTAVATGDPTARQQPDPDPCKKEEPKGSSEKNVRGKRLPENWFLPRDWGAWAVQEGLAESVVRIEADTFRDYWHSLPGSKARKVDWFAVWRNWVRRVIKEKPKLKAINGGGYVGTSKSEERVNSFVAGARGS